MPIESLGLKPQHATIKKHMEIELILRNLAANQKPSVFALACFFKVMSCMLLRNVE